MNEATKDLIQLMLNTFIMHNSRHDPLKPKRAWLNKEVLYGQTSQEGLNLPKVADFFNGLKCCSWLRRYAITKIDDHWADQIDSFLGLTPDNRDIQKTSNY